MTIEPLHPSEVPPGYPRSCERELRLADGRRIFVRPILPTDAPALRWAIEHADAATLRSRFMGGAPKTTPEFLTHLTTVDYTGRLALVAGDMATGQGIAVARYGRLDDDVAEVAVAVDPGWRRVGVATALIEILAEAALDRGIHAFTATYFAENRPVAGLMDLAGDGGTLIIKHGIAESVVQLDRRLAGDAPPTTPQPEPGRPL